MTIYGYAIVVAGSVLWAAPFPFVRSGQQRPVKLDRGARWGVGLQFLGYTLLWQGPFWTRTSTAWQEALSIFFFATASLISWNAARALGRQLRVDAALDSSHELIRSGPYRLVRHPIYTSMLCVLAGTGLLITGLYLFLIALLVFLIGAGIRMRIEDKLLASRFGEQFQEYRRNVPRMIPFLS